MMKINIKHLILVSMVVFLVAPLAHANVVINEVQISPTEERFVELYNNDNSAVDLADWYLQRKTATGSSFGSLVSKTNFEGKKIEANSYFLISKVSLANSNIVEDSLTLTESNSIQLKNNNGDVVDKIGWGEATDCGSVCVPNPADGKSISKNSSGNWIISSPTPGILNSNSEITEADNTNTNNDNNQVSTIESSSNSSSLQKETKIYKIVTKIISPKIVTAGVPFTIDHQTAGTKNEKVIYGKFIWNFGDGMKKEEVTSDAFEYIYQYSGDYVLTLSYYNTSLDLVPSATDRVNIKVIPSGLSISSIGTNLDPYIEIENNSTYEMLLKNFVVRGSAHSFMIPDGMTILPKSKLKLSPKITNFDFNDLNSITITDLSGQIFATYPTSKVSIAKDISISKNTENTTKAKKGIENIEAKNTNEIINLNNLGASVALSKETSTSSKGYYVLFGLIVVIITGISIVIIFRRKSVYPNYSEYDLNAKDMTIIE